VSPHGRRPPTGGSRDEELSMIRYLTAFVYKDLCSLSFIKLTFTFLIGSVRFVFKGISFRRGIIQGESGT